MSNLNNTVNFIKEIEKLKAVTRFNRTLDGRFENSAEHIHNIIYNSVLHNEKGCTIRIHLFKKDTNVIVEIKDNGQGASPEKIVELNELSFKNIDISKIRTTGIGLKISKQIVDLHQGSISFASVQNEFFESIISLPIFNITN